MSTVGFLRSRSLNTLGGAKFFDTSLADEIAKVLSEHPEMIASALESKA